MNYNVAQLLKEPIGSQRDFSIEETITDAEQPANYAAGAVRMVRTHQGIWVQADLTVIVAQDCSRCLADFSRTLELELDEEYFPEVDVRTGHRLFPPMTGKDCTSAPTTFWIWPRPLASPRWRRSR